MTSYNKAQEGHDKAQDWADKAQGPDTPSSNWDWLQARVESTSASSDFHAWMSDELENLETVFAELITAKSRARSACNDNAGNRE